MSQTLTPVQPAAPAPTRPDAAIYTGPDDVVADPNLTTAKKRAILASWVSDARAVENAPALRRLDSGAVVAVDAILEALRRLDRSDSIPDAGRPAPAHGQRGIVLRWPLRSGASESFDDDDPPPAPASLAIPFRPTFVAAYGRPRKVAAGAR